MRVRRALMLMGPSKIGGGLVNSVVTHFRRGNLRITTLGLIGIARTRTGFRCTRRRNGPFFNRLISFVASTPLIYTMVHNRGTVGTIHRLGNTAGPVRTIPNSVHNSFTLDVNRGVIRNSSDPRTTRHRVGGFFTPRRVCWLALTFQQP